MKSIVTRSALSISLLLFASHSMAASLTIKRAASPSQPRLQAISVNPNGEIWASGINGQIVYSSNDGSTWQNLIIEQTETLQFRDIWTNNHIVYVLAAGEGSQSRLYKSTDSGKHWQLQYTMDNPKGFINCFDFWDNDNGIVFGDSIDHQTFMLRTTNGGKNWSRIESAPTSNPGGEGGFSASGSCVRASGDSTAWISTGATAQASLLRTNDRGVTWQRTPLPFPNSSTGGIFSAIPTNAYAFGGQMKPAISTGYRKVDNHWLKLDDIPLTGAIYGSANYENNVVIVNPDGVALSNDGGQTWRKISDEPFWAVEISRTGTAWLAGPKGQIATIPKLHEDARFQQDEKRAKY